MPMMTFEETPNQQRIAMKIGIQILSQIKHVVEVNIVPIEGVFDQLVKKKEVNIILKIAFQGQNVILRGG